LPATPFGGLARRYACPPKATGDGWQPQAKLGDGSPVSPAACLAGSFGGFGGFSLLLPALTKAECARSLLLHFELQFYTLRFKL